MKISVEREDIKRVLDEMDGYYDEPHERAVAILEQILIKNPDPNAIKSDNEHYRFSDWIEDHRHVDKFLSATASKNKHKLSSPQIAEFLVELADTMAAYFYNCRKDSKEAQNYGRFLDEMMEKLNKYEE